MSAPVDKSVMGTAWYKRGQIASSFFGVGEAEIVQEKFLTMVPDAKCKISERCGLAGKPWWLLEATWQVQEPQPPVMRSPEGEA